MSSKENSASGFSDWYEVISALDTEIVASQEKKTEISLFDGKRLRDKHNNEDYFYTFVVNADDRIQSDQITEIRFKDNILNGARLIKATTKKAIVAIPKTLDDIPLKIPILIIVNDPSFILQRLKEAIELISSAEDPTYSSGFIDTIFGSKMNIRSKYDGSNLVNESTFTYNSRQKDAIKKSIENRVLFIFGYLIYYLFICF